ncbi:MAG: S9 family peptidase [Gammaproteobacteria bacterium]|nr:S9 family peptidase [Gammaproteobacteria bacterium]
MAIFGAHDLNVDAAESASIYKEIFEKSGNKNLTIKIFPEAQHGLLKKKYFKETVPGIGFIIKFELLGEYAFADGFLDFITRWVKEKTVNE